jgi:phosphoribosylformylglycinamidine (FGAM) synthase-like enzyme
MTFGLIKSIIEENLLESYKDEKSFKRAVSEFKQNILNNKDISKVYALYDELSKPQGLSVDDAKDYLSEGISVIQKLLEKIKLPKIIGESQVKNKYNLIDDLVYFTNVVNLTERVEVKKQLIKNLQLKSKISESNINIPISSMVKIANQTINSYIDSLDEESKKEFFEIIREDSSILENKFVSLKEITLAKLVPLAESQHDNDTKVKIEETIKKIEEDSFSQINFLKLKKLHESL